LKPTSIRAPYGRNIEGVSAASQIYFGKTAAHLTRPESLAERHSAKPDPTRVVCRSDNGALNAVIAIQQARRTPALQPDDRYAGARFSTALFKRTQTRPALWDSGWCWRLEKAATKAHTDPAKEQLIERRIADYVRSNRGHQNGAACSSIRATWM
jgi:hypothetical protein